MVRLGQSIQGNNILKKKNGNSKLNWTDLI